MDVNYLRSLRPVNVFINTVLVYRSKLKDLVRRYHNIS